MNKMIMILPFLFIFSAYGNDLSPNEKEAVIGLLGINNNEFSPKKAMESFQHGTEVINKVNQLEMMALRSVWERSQKGLPCQ